MPIAQEPLVDSHHALFVGLNFRHVLCVVPDHFARADLGRSGQQFFVKRISKDHGVPALSLVAHRR